MRVAAATFDDDLRALVSRAVARDPDAWEALFRRSYRNLFSFARRRLLDDQAADDAVSETMMRALDNIDRFRWQGGGFDAWLYGIARNVVYEHVRSRRRTSPMGADDPVATEPGPEDRAVTGAEVAAVRHAFARLTPDEQELLELRVQGGLSSEDVGRLIGKKPVAVRMAQSRALSRLRTFLGEVHRAH